tara:strand:- start:61508 stop:62047 length:540 start_codon:yes stop_codon:yes gene_type:complete
MLVGSPGFAADSEIGWVDEKESLRAGALLEELAIVLALDYHSPKSHCSPVQGPKVCKHGGRSVTTAGEDISIGPEGASGPVIAHVHPATGIESTGGFQFGFRRSPGYLEFVPGVSGESDRADQLPGSIPEHSKESAELSVHVVVVFKSGAVLSQQHGSASAKKVNIHLVRREVLEDPIR